MKGRYNQDFKEKVRSEGFTLCEIGFRAGLSEATAFRWLRYYVAVTKVLKDRT